MEEKMADRKMATMTAWVRYGWTFHFVLAALAFCRRMAWFEPGPRAGILLRRTLRWRLGKGRWRRFHG